MRRAIFTRDALSSGTAIVSYLALFKLVLHLATSGRYGYFRDELYFAACGEHLDWGYVDHAPLVGVYAWASRALLGDSLFALRFLPAVAGAIKVFLAGMMARELGGKRFAQMLAALAALVAPIYLGVDNVLSMNAFEPLFWMGCAYVVILILKGGDERLWLLFGALAGAGLMNKHSMLFFGFALIAGLAVTPARRVFLGKWFWAGGLIAFVIFLPNLVWEMSRNWPTLELLRNVANSNKNAAASPFEFILQQILILHPATFPLWLAGLYYYLASNDGRRFRALGWAYLIALVTFIVLKGKHYYLAPIYPMLFASGAVVVEGFVLRRGLNWLKPAVTTALVVLGMVTAPLALPILPVETFIKYSGFIGLEDSVKTENHEKGKLPQQYADMHGWENMAATVARVYERLSPEEKAKCAIFGQNYGEAGAIDYFGARYNLPKAISGHQSYFVWGPRDYTGEVMIVMGDNEKRLKELFAEVEQAETIKCEYSMPYENNLPVFLCRGMKTPLPELWPKIKKWI
ncbi:MAG TPA: glycosyltransferase family 39 protein [Blastocatellia bacterium]|nr:glycosyltransferase family 39 protein [Blastocatellia bacterium]